VTQAKAQAVERGGVYSYHCRRLSKPGCSEPNAFPIGELDHVKALRPIEISESTPISKAFSQPGVKSRNISRRTHLSAVYDIAILFEVAFQARMACQDANSRALPHQLACQGLHVSGWAVHRIKRRPSIDAQADV
jgi:hypothetical protein